MSLNKIGVFYMFFFGCSGETFTQFPINKIILPDTGIDPTDASGDEMVSDASTDTREASEIDTPADVIKPLCSDPNDVEYNNHCFYLDGSKGICDSGYTLSSNARLAQILGSNPNAWQGKSYRHQISDNACVMTKDSVENYGLTTHANLPGPFGPNEPIWNGSSCMGVYFTQSKQLTLCESL